MAATARFGMGSDLATSERLEALMGMVDNHRKHTRYPANTLNVEVDGEVVAGIQMSADPQEVMLPRWCRSLTLRDDDDVTRAHILVQEQQLEQAPFDQGRLLLSVQHVADGTVRLTIEQATISVP